MEALLNFAEAMLALMGGCAGGTAMGALTWHLRTRLRWRGVFMPWLVVCVGIPAIACLALELIPLRGYVVDCALTLGVVVLWFFGTERWLVRSKYQRPKPAPKPLQPSSELLRVLSRARAKVVNGIGARPIQAIPSGLVLMIAWPIPGVLSIFMLRLGVAAFASSRAGYPLAPTSLELWWSDPIQLPVYFMMGFGIMATQLFWAHKATEPS